LGVGIGFASLPYNTIDLGPVIGILGLFCSGFWIWGAMPEVAFFYEFR